VLSFIPRLTGKKVVVNVDGIERHRPKWNKLGKMWYRFGEIFSCVFPNEIVTDAKMIEKYYQETYNKKSHMIAYGYNSEEAKTTKALEQYNLAPREYILLVSRFEPENNIHRAIQAFKGVKTDKKLVLVGDAPYATEYKANLYALAKEDTRIIFTGYVFGQSYRELQSNSYCYIHGGEVGGTPPALVEAMGYGNCIIANGTPENSEVIADSGLIYKKNDIKDFEDKLQYIINNPDIAKVYREKSRARAEKYYSWDNITDQYEQLFDSLLKSGSKNKALT
jgi:glycosyltransferase involved in cell wall biosynthesis